MKKAQVATEMLLMYGFAFVAIIVAVAAISYFDIFNFNENLPETCYLPAGMDCVDKAVITENNVTFALKNNQINPVYVNNLSVSGCSGDTMVAVGKSNRSFTSLPNVVPINGLFKLTIGCPGLLAGDRFESIIQISYTNIETGLSNYANGEIKGLVV